MKVCAIKGCSNPVIARGLCFPHYQRLRRGSDMGPAIAGDYTEATLAVLRLFIAEYGYSPSVRQIAQHLGVASTSTVQNRLRKLEQAGLIVRDPGTARSIQIVEKKI